MKFHFYRIKINSKHIYRLLNCCRNNEIRDVELILKENNIEIVNRQELGIYTKITNLQFIKSVIYIFAIFILLLIANSAFIWKITIKGNYSYTAEQMIDYVHKKGVKEGVLKESIDTESLEKSIRKNFGDISWVCVEVKGTNLIIHIKENYITEISVKEDKPYDLVAECDCTIVSALVRRGKLNVNPKEKVKKGQVLITGVVDVTDESDEVAAKRETLEETGLEVADFEYICSMPVNDWRYRGMKDRSIMTRFFKAKYIFGCPTPQDDINALKWFKLTPELENILVEEHKKLFKKLINVKNI